MRYLILISLCILISILVSAIWIVLEIRKIPTHGMSQADIDRINRISVKDRAITDNMKDALRGAGDKK